MSERITFTADDATVEILDAVEQCDDIDSTAAAVRECITESARLQREYDAIQHAHEREVETLTEEIVELERKLERSQNAYQTLIEERQEKQELVRYVEDERTAQDKWRHAGLLTKAKWAVTGMPEERD